MLLPIAIFVAIGPASGGELLEDSSAAYAQTPTSDDVEPGAERVAERATSNRPPVVGDDTTRSPGSSTSEGVEETPAVPETPAADSPSVPSPPPPSTAPPASEKPPVEPRPVAEVAPVVEPPTPSTPAPTSAPEPPAVPSPPAPPASAPTAPVVEPPVTTQPPVRSPLERGQAALAKIDYPWAERLPGWQISFQHERGGAYGYTLVQERRIEVYVRADQSDELLAHVVAHEIGHAVDVTLNNGDERDRWLEARGIQGATWWPNSGAADFSTGAGDFAESFAAWQVGTQSFRSKLAPAPSPAQLDVMQQLASG